MEHSIISKKMAGGMIIFSRLHMYILNEWNMKTVSNRFEKEC